MVSEGHTENPRLSKFSGVLGWVPFPLELMPVFDKPVKVGTLN